MTPLERTCLRRSTDIVNDADGGVRAGISLSGSDELALHVLGIDAGGTKTVCQLADDSGEVLAEARRGGANLQAIGELEVEKVLHDVMEEAIGDLDVSPAAICLGIAGVDRPDDARVVRGIMKRIGYKAKLLVVNDALVALEAGAPDQPGVVVIAGTGSIAYGRNDRNQAARAGGWGYMLGDEGSGYWIGRAALRAVLREADRRGPATQLTGAAAQLLRRRARAGPHSPGLPRHAAAGGDRLARAVRAGRRSPTATRWRSASCAAPPTSSSRRRSRWRKRLELVGSEFPFVLSGGIFRAVPWLEEELARRLPLASPRSRTILLNVEPAGGAVRLALAEARGGYTRSGVQAD